MNFGHALVTTLLILASLAVMMAVVLGSAVAVARVTGSPTAAIVTGAVAEILVLTFLVAQIERNYR